MLFRVVILVIQSRKLTIIQKLMKLRRISDHDHSNNYITMQESNKVPSKNVAPELAQSNLARKNDIAALVKKKERF